MHDYDIYARYVGQSPSSFMAAASRHSEVSISEAARDHVAEHDFDGEDDPEDIIDSIVAVLCVEFDDMDPDVAFQPSLYNGDE